MHALNRLPAFPPPTGAGELILDRAVSLRAAGPDDLPFLRTLFHAQKSEEMALADWPEPFRQAFLDQQFVMQHTQYVSAYAGADFWIVVHRKQPIGRYYLLREPLRYHIVDIALERAWRGRGVGNRLLDWTQSLAREHGAATISLQVDERNIGAQRLYARHGFVETARETPSIAMQWSRPFS